MGGKKRIGKRRIRESNGRRGRKHKSDGGKMRKGQKASEETRKKMSEWQKGKKLSEEHKEKMKLNHVGMTGRIHTEETKDKMKMAAIGRHPDEKTRQKMANAKKNMSKEQREKIALKQTGKKQSIESIMKRSGKNCHFWKGGISFEPYCTKWTKELRERIRAFFEYRCICCGKLQNELKRKLSCHHVEYSKSACCDGKPVHFAAMCMKHHNMTNKDRERWENMLHRIIDEIYNGKSYYTKEEYKKICINPVEQVQHDEQKA
jgi:hypothetical protein